MAAVFSSGVGLVLPSSWPGVTCNKICGNTAGKERALSSHNREKKSLDLGPDPQEPCLVDKRVVPVGIPSCGGETRMVTNGNAM